METEYEKIRKLGEKYNVDPKNIEKMIEALDKVLCSAHELELSTQNDFISFKFKNKNREII